MSDDRNDEILWEAYLRDRHRAGQHDAEPHEECPLCEVDDGE